tara:strand:- start:2792 stop:3217 length:426 start_codon:yes stop_codon:yes gene_type:complete
MIKYQLTCKKCRHIFDSWFASSKEFDKLKKLKLINCNKCNSIKIDKSVMSPNVSSNIILNKEKNNTKLKKIKSKIKEFQTYIRNNFENVGENFTYEARSIHYGEKNSKKGIYGSATSKQIKELKEEGIETALIPWVNENEN